MGDCTVQYIRITYPVAFPVRARSRPAGYRGHPLSPFRPDFPFAPARLPFFYGWGILVVATLGVIMSIPGQTMGVSVFTDHLIEATGLSRLQLSAAYLVGTLGSSILLPFGGNFLDRHGSRVTAASATVALAITLCILTRVDRVAVLVADTLGLPSAVPVAGVLLALSFTVLRFSGQGMLTMSSRTMLSKWFERRRGLVAGIAGVFISFGFASAPPILQAIIELGDWRLAWLGLAACVGFGMTIVAWLFYRDNPEECGLRMDGDPLGPESAISSPMHEVPDGSIGHLDDEPAYTRGEAIRTAAFWYVTLSVALDAMVFTGLTFHIVDIGKDAGIGGKEAVALFFPIAVVSTSAGLISGWSADRVPVRPLVLIFLVTQLSGFYGASRLDEPLWVGVMIVGWGISGGLFGTILSVAIPGFFGRKHLGAIASLQMSCIVAGSALGPAFLAAAKDQLGSYRDGLLLCCAMAVVAFVFAAFAPNPARR